VNVSSDDGIYGGYPPLAAIREGCLLTQASFSLPRPLSLLCANRGHIIYCPPPSTLETERPRARAQNLDTQHSRLYTLPRHTFWRFLESHTIQWPSALGRGITIEWEYTSYTYHAFDIQYPISPHPHNLLSPHKCPRTVHGGGDDGGGNFSYGPTCRTIVLYSRISVKKDSDRAALVPPQATVRHRDMLQIALVRWFRPQSLVLSLFGILGAVN